MDDDSNLLELLAAGGGGAAGLAAANSDALNKLLVYLKTRRRVPGHDLRVPVFAGADEFLAHGSGEAMMGQRISRMLNRHGIGSYYTNTNGGTDMSNTSLDQWLADTVRNNKQFWARDFQIDHNNLAALQSVPVNIGGESSNALDVLVGRLEAAGIPRAKALIAFQSGMFDGFTPGELYDNFKVGGNAAIQNLFGGDFQMEPRSRMKRWFRGQGLPYTMTSEAGMKYSTLAPGEWDRIAQDTHPFSAAPETKNLSLPAEFQANYRSPGDKLIPGIGISDPGPLRRSVLARKWQYYAPKILGGGGRSEYLRAIDRIARANGIDPKTISPRTKFMLISTGAAGANAAEKLRIAEKAFMSDPNVRIILQYGKANPAAASKGLDMYTNNGVMEEIARINQQRPGFVMAFDRDPAYATLARNVDLHGAYGGSSSISEALTSTNPTVALSDTGLNYGNIEYATGNRGIPMVDTGATALLRELRSGRPEGDVINTRDNLADDLTLGRQVDKFGLRDKDLGQMEDEAVRILRDKMYHSPDKFSHESVDAANRFIDAQHMRDTQFADAIRGEVEGHINRVDRGMFPGRPSHIGVPRAILKINPKFFMRSPIGRGIGSGMSVIRGMFSGRPSHIGVPRAIRKINPKFFMRSPIGRGIGSRMSGIRGMNARMFRTPAGRRFGIPAMILGALGAGYGTKKLLD